MSSAWWFVGVPVVSYAVLSILLSRYPQILHRRRSSFLRLFSNPNTFIVSTHRGGSAEQRENTLAAFRYSIDLHQKTLGATHQTTRKYPLLLELDVRLTKDQEVVVYHDETTERCHEGEPKKINDITLTELLARPFRDPLPLPPPFHPPHSTLQPVVHLSSSSAEAARVATLSELFEITPKDVFLNIDLKDASPILLEKVAQLIERFDRKNTVIWGSGRPAAIAQCKKRLPDVASMASASSVALIYFGSLFGFLPFLPLRHVDIFEVPLITSTYVENILAMRRAGMKASGGGDVPLWQRALLHGLAYLTRQKGMYEHLQRRGIQTVFWVLNEEEELKEAVENYAVKGLMTDYPTRLFQFVKENEKKIEKIPKFVFFSAT